MLHGKSAECHVGRDRESGQSLTVQKETGHLPGGKAGPGLFKAATPGGWNARPGHHRELSVGLVPFTLVPVSSFSTKAQFRRAPF